MMVNFDMFKKTGRCPVCSIEKPLDSMVIKDYQKNEYECIDCKVEREKDRRFPYVGKKEMQFSKEFKELEINSKTNKLIRWCFG